MVYHKEVHELWWEYLKRSKNFRIFCDGLRKYPDPERAFLEKMSILLCVPEMLPSSREKIAFKKQLLWMNYDKFGDVFRSNFEDWWKSKQSDNSDKIVEDLEETIEREACFFVGHCAKLFKVADINDENIIELLHKYFKFQNESAMSG